MESGKSGEWENLELRESGNGGGVAGPVRIVLVILIVIVLETGQQLSGNKTEKDKEKE